MEINNQIRQLRLRRGITQEMLAQKLGVTAQAVSKWERGAATPDIAMLPDISAFFGVTIDELFALSDDTRMERIQNMLWDDRYFDLAEVEASRAFLVDKGRREPENGKVYEFLAEMENHLAEEHHEKAKEYAIEALHRNPDLRNAHSELNAAMHGMIPDWNARNHYLQINFYREHIRTNPKDWRAYMWMMDQLVDDYRLDEAEAYLADFAQIDSSYRVLLYRGIIAWQKGDRDHAFALWEEMERKFPEEWCVWHNIGDFKARCGQYDVALTYYRKALEVQGEPPMLDPLQAIAQLCEIRGDIPGAIAAKREEAERIENQWHIRGEELDCVLREVARLEKLVK